MREPSGRLLSPSKARPHINTAAHYASQEPTACLLRCRAIESLQPESRGPLYGIPFGVKDNIDVAGLPTTASCETFKYIPVESAPVVQVLLDAGMLFNCSSSFLMCKSSQCGLWYMHLPVGASCRASGYIVTESSLTVQIVLGAGKQLTGILHLALATTVQQVNRVFNCI